MKIGSKNVVESDITLAKDDESRTWNPVIRPQDIKTWGETVRDLRQEHLDRAYRAYRGSDH